MLEKNKKMKADKELKALGLACVNLTPAMKNAISEMQQKEVLEVFNLLGQEIVTLVSQKLIVGNHATDWNAS